MHRLDLDAAGAAFWDGQRVEDAALPALLSGVRADGATPYGRYDEVLAVVKKAGIERLGMVDNQRFAADVR